jgi:hypothetical protein
MGQATYRLPLLGEPSCRRAAQATIRAFHTTQKNKENFNDESTQGHVAVRSVSYHDPPLCSRSLLVALKLLLKDPAFPMH